MASLTLMELTVALFRRSEPASSSTEEGRLIEVFANSPHQTSYLAPGLAYNLFRYRLTPDLCCAVAEDRPVPGFLDRSIWKYAGTLHCNHRLPLGFDPAAAEMGIHLNGFYLFQIADS